MSGYSGTAGDGFTKTHNGRPFSSPDRNTDPTTYFCANIRFAGFWWGAACGVSNTTFITAEFPTGVDYFTWYLNNPDVYNVYNDTMWLRCL